MDSFRDNISKACHPFGMILRTSLCILLAVIVSAAGALQGGIGLTAYAEPAYATAINSAIVIAGTAAIEICNLFVKE